MHFFDLGGGEREENIPTQSGAGFYAFLALAQTGWSNLKTAWANPSPPVEFLGERGVRVDPLLYGRGNNGFFCTRFWTVTPRKVF